MKSNNEKNDLLITLISNNFPWKDQIKQKINKENFFTECNDLQQMLILFYEENNSFKSYLNNLQVEFTENDENNSYNQLILQEVIDSDQFNEFSYKNFYFSIFLFQKFPFEKTILIIIDKYAEKLVSYENNEKFSISENCFPDRNEINNLLQINFTNSNQPNKNAILIIYFILIYFEKKKRNAKNLSEGKYDLDFFYALPFQYHIFSYYEYNGNEYHNETQNYFKDSLNKLIMNFTPVLRSHSFLFLDFNGLRKINIKNY